MNKVIKPKFSGFFDIPATPQLQRLRENPKETELLPRLPASLADNFLSPNSCYYDTIKGVFFQENNPVNVGIMRFFSINNTYF